MWLIIRKKDGAVLGTNYNCAPLAPKGCEIKEWFGAEPAVHDPRQGIESYDPTVGLAEDHEYRVGLPGRVRALEARISALEELT